MDYQQKCVVTQDKLDELGLNNISINSELEKELRKQVEYSVMLQTYPFIDLNYNLISATTSYGASPKFEAVKRRFKFEYDGNIEIVASSYIEAVVDDFRNLKYKILQANEGRAIDRVILRGKASLMPWVKTRVREIFDTATIDFDPLQSFVVVRGVALYTRKMMDRE